MRHGGLGVDTFPQPVGLCRLAVDEGRRHPLITQSQVGPWGLVDQPCTREWRGPGARLGAGWPTPSSDLMAALGFGATIILLTGGETEALGG